MNISQKTYWKAFTAILLSFMSVTTTVAIGMALLALLIGGMQGAYKVVAAITAIGFGATLIAAIALPTTSEYNYCKIIIKDMMDDFKQTNPFHIYIYLPYKFFRKITRTNKIIAL